MITRALALCGLGFLGGVCMFPLGAQAQTDSAQWEGLWQAEGTLFQLRVRALNNTLQIEAVESLGFEWRNSAGQINGNSATFEVEYQGVTATVLVQKNDAVTAIARPVTCQPDYHVVCALVQNQQARFIKQNVSP